MAQDLEENTPGNNNEQEQEVQKKKPAKSRHPMMDVFGVNLNEKVFQGKIDTLIGRENEIDRLVQVLSRKKKNNPVLVGEPGTGKTAICEGLAKKIVEKKVNRTLLGKTIFTLDLTLVVAGTKFRGQFEERMAAILNELITNPDIIVFIDEIHTIIGAGNAGGTMDAANILKPALSRGEIQIIGSTTISEFKNSIESDGAMERRFQKIQIDEPSIDESKEIIRNIKESYGDYHNVVYSNEICDLAVDLSVRYITNRFLPDKAIDIIDEIGSFVKTSNISTPPKSLIKIEKRMEEITVEKQMFVKRQEYEKAANIRSEEKELERELELEKKKWQDGLKNDKIIITEKDVYSIVSKITKIPVEKITEEEGKKLLKMPEFLNKSVIGQNEAVLKVSEALQIAKAGLNNIDKPIASLLFLGSTGVGKTELCKNLAEYMFGGKDSFIRFDMSEFSMQHTVSKLVGSPPGFINSEKGGELTEKVRNHPYSVVLFDEIEKAHPDVHKFLLQIMSDGRLTDGLGKVVNFKNTIIVMTSNVGSKEIQTFKKVGFETGNEFSTSDETKSVIEKALKKAFPMEFLGRVDETIFFNNLTKENIKEIVELEVNKFIKHTEKEGYKISVSDELKKIIAEEGYSPDFGARPTVKMVRNYLQKPLSLKILSGEASKTKVNKMDYDVDKKEVVIS